MTRKERIDWLCRLRSWLPAPPRMTAGQVSKFIEALTDSIKDLTTEPCEDAISRQAVLECLDWYEHDRCEIDIYIREIVEDIKKLPSVQPEQKVIRCKDCKHRPIRPNECESGFDLDFPDDVCPCQCEDGWYSHYPSDDWFCAYGEAKMEEGE